MKSDAHDATPLLRVCDVSRTFRMGDIEVHALRDASIDLRRGEFLVIVGPSGSGKSTLLNLIGGMDRPTTGSVWFGDRDLSNASNFELTEYRRHQVGFVFQFYNLIANLTAEENVAIAAELVKDPMDPKEALARVGLTHRASHFPSQLSGGEQQRVAIARALVSRPPLLLCDEPTGALDLETSRQVLHLLQTLKDETGVTVVLITHNGAIRAIADRVASIRDGRIASIDDNPSPIRALDVAW